MALLVSNHLKASRSTGRAFMRATTSAIAIRASRSDRPTSLSTPGRPRASRDPGKAFRSHRTRVVHFHAVEFDVRGIAIQRLIRGLLQLAASQSPHNALRSCRQFRGGLEEELIPGKLCFNDLNQFGPLGLGNRKACSEVEERLLLHLAANSAALDQANGSMPFCWRCGGSVSHEYTCPHLRGVETVWESLK